MLEACPRTEDFLKFLCFRNCPDILPDSLKFFSDPLKHNFPNGVPATDKKPDRNNVPTKQEISNKGEAKNTELKPSKISKGPPARKSPTLVKKVPIINQSKVGVGRIHSSFRRAALNSGIMTRMGRLKSSSDVSASKSAKQQILKSKQTSKKTSPPSKRVATRSQLRQAPKEPSSSESSSTDSSDSDESDKSNKKQPKVTAKKKKKIPIKVLHHKRPNVKRNSPVSRNTRQSAAKCTSITQETSKKKMKKAIHVKDTPLSPRRKQSAAESKESAKKKVSSLLSTVAKKVTRETVKKLKSATPTNVVPSRRPSRRTKEAATLFMTLMGQEEEFYSSEMEEKQVKNPKKEDTSQPPLKKSRVSDGAKPERRSVSPPIRTRRSALHSSLPSSPAKRRATILQEAAKRFTETESSSCDSSTDSSSEEDETPVRSIRTRSFDPSLIAKSSPTVSKRDEDVRATRANSVKSRLSEKAPIRTEVKKTVKPVTEKVKRSSSLTKRTVTTPPLSYDCSSLIEAPVFHPNEKEFTDPIEYLEKIRPECERFGICRIVPPPSFKPECQVSDAMRFTANNQYIHRMFRRRGPNSRILEAIHRHLRALDIDYQPAPCIGSIEVDLPGLYQAVQDLGGPGHVLENNLWSKVADMLKVSHLN